VALSVPALALRGHAFSGTFGEPCSTEPCGGGQLKEPSGIAVNEASGQIYVLDQGDARIERFSSAGAYEAQFDGSETPAKAFAFGSEALSAGIAIDNSCYFKGLTGSACSAADPSNGDVYVTDFGHGVVDKFSPDGMYIGQLMDESGESAFIFQQPIDGVGVDTSGTVWVYQFGEFAFNGFTNAVQSLFTSLREKGHIELLSAGASPGFAVDSKDDFYARGLYFVGEGSFYYMTEFNSEGAPLVEAVGHEETSAGATDLSNDEAFFDNISSVGAFNASGSLEERFGSDVLVDGSGLAVSHARGTVYVVDSATSMVDVFSPEPAAAPTVRGVSVSYVRATSATLEAQIDPRGASTEYHFEYGSCASIAACASSPYGESVPVPEGSAGSDFEVHSVSVHVQDLAAGTVYHVRVVAHNEKNEPGTVVYGEERVITTQTTGVPLQLPDGRAWEMVSPPQKEGALLGQISEGIIQASLNGDAFTDWTLFEPTEGSTAGAYGFYVPVFFGRGPDGWTSRVIAPPHSGPSSLPLGQGQEYYFFSEDLSKGVLQPFGLFTPLAPGVSETTPYLRTDYLNGTPSEQCTSGCYQPLVNDANVPSGAKYGDEPGGECKNGFCGPGLVGATPDARHVVLRTQPSSDALTSVPTEGYPGLYEWGDGVLQLVSLLPVGETNERGGPVAVEAQLGGGQSGEVARAISTDGSRVIWMGRNGSSGGVHLYLRYTGGALKRETVRLDVFEGVPKGPEEGYAIEYMTASNDGSRIFFLDGERLTADSTAKPAQPDLYEYDLDAPPGSRLTDLSVPSNPLEAADVSRVQGASEDGSYVYFTADGALTPGAVRGACTKNEGKLCNLYVRHDGKTAFIAALSPEDSYDWREATRRSARVSPDGRWLAFMSDRSLTGYGTADAVSKHADEEVYLYNAVSGRLVCASCNPTGARPVGVEFNEQLVAAFQFLRGRWVASNVPPWTSFDLTQAIYQSRYLSDSGRLFFNSNDALVAQDVNGTQDVYEYEPAGVGDCTTAKLTFSERSDGCVSPVSSGTSNEESAFLDASEAGRDVFFLTGAKLATQDFDNALDIYDARECTAGKPCFPAAPVPPPACDTGESCKPAESAQPTLFGAPASATFSGTGSVSAPVSGKTVSPRSLTRKQKLARALRACHRKERRRQRHACERNARRQYGARAAHRMAGANDGLSSRTGR
jgi:hypothetical protein